MAPEETKGGVLESLGLGPKPLPATTEESLHAVGQRKINLIWELTQSFVAVSVTVATLYAALNKIDSTALNNTFFLVVGFYFGRTNHQKIGGVQLGR